MKKVAQLGFVLGFAIMVAAGYFLPWISYERHPSATTVIVNGGRSERFLIRLPSDRIYSAADLAATTAVSGALFGPHTLDTDSPIEGHVRLEHYKLRDVSGNVIGVAVRHGTRVPGGGAAAWLLAVPSRGGIVFAGPDAPADVVEATLVGRGWQPGESFSDTAAVARAERLVSRHVYGEFEGLDFTLAETWELAGIDAEGKLRGTIRLDTIGRRPQ